MYSILNINILAVKSHFFYEINKNSVDRRFFIMYILYFYLLLS